MQTGNKCRVGSVASGRVFSLSSTELENVGPGKEKSTHYLVARDACKTVTS